MNELIAFLEAELSRRQISLLPDEDPYIKEAREVLARAEEVDDIIARIKQYDKSEGYGASDAGYNLLSDLYDAAGIEDKDE